MFLVPLFDLNLPYIYRDRGHRDQWRPEHDPEKAWPGLDPGWVPVFGKACPRARPEGSCSTN